MQPETVIPSDRFTVLDGIQRQLSVSAPAAGAEWSTQLGEGYFWRLLYGTVRFVIATAGATRRLGIVVQTGVATVYRMHHPGTNSAAGTYALTLAERSDPLMVPANSSFVDILPMDRFWIPSGYTIGSHTVSLQANDQYSNINLVFECIDAGAYRFGHIEHQLHRGIGV